jgi:hypothetical protein
VFFGAVPEFQEREFRATHATLGNVRVVLRIAGTLDATAWERSWKPRLKGQREYDFPWREQLEASDTTADRQCLALDRDGNLEGLISLAVEHAGSRLEEGASLVYVEYLGTAPDNYRPPIGSWRFRAWVSLC